MFPSVFTHSLPTKNIGMESSFFQHLYYVTFVLFLSELFFVRNFLFISLSLSLSFDSAWYVHHPSCTPTYTPHTQPQYPVRGWGVQIQFFGFHFFFWSVCNCKGSLFQIRILITALVSTGLHWTLGAHLIHYRLRNNYWSLKPILYLLTFELCFSKFWTLANKTYFVWVLLLHF